MKKFVEDDWVNPNGNMSKKMTGSNNKNDDDAVNGAISSSHLEDKMNQLANRLTSELTSELKIMLDKKMTEVTAQIDSGNSESKESLLAEVNTLIENSKQQVSERFPLPSAKLDSRNRQLTTNRVSH